MKTNHLLRTIVAVMFLLFFGAPMKAAEVPSSVEEMAVIEKFLCLSDPELEQMARVIERLRAMQPAERSALRQEIAQYRQLPERQRAQLRRGWGGMPQEVQNGWREMMQAASPERHAEIQAKLQSLPPDGKAAYRRELVEEFQKAEAAKKTTKHE